MGVHGLGHDVSMAIIDRDGAVIHIAEQERYSRVKGSTKTLERSWVRAVLAEVGVTPADIGVVAVAGVPALMVGRSRYGPQFDTSAGRSSWAMRLAEDFPDLERLDYVRHHAAHAASAAWSAPFSACLVITADGMGETDTITVSAFREATLRTLVRVQVPDSLGWVFRRLCNWAGIGGVEREGKFMGLAAHGRPRLVAELRESVLTVDSSGFPRLNKGLAVAAEFGSEQAYLDDLLGEVSPQSCPLEQNSAPPAVMDLSTQLAADVAASIQVLLYEVVNRLVKDHSEREGVKNVAVAGGVFMNSVLNGQLSRSEGLDGFFAQPLAGDNGLALGAALASVRPRHTGLLPDLYLGSDTGSPALADLSREFDKWKIERPSDLPAAIATLIVTGNPVAICRGRAEVGSRALGHRSILGSAARPETGQLINRVLKRREPWRPFAATVLEEATPGIFGRRLDTPFMMEVHPLSNPELSPSVAHVDGTTRPQTVSRSTGDALLVAVLQRVEEMEGVPMVLNTSLNGPGEPMARNFTDAIQLFSRSGLDAMVVDDILIRKVIR